MNNSYNISDLLNLSPKLKLCCILVRFVHDSKIYIYRWTKVLEKVVLAEIPEEYEQEDNVSDHSDNLSDRDRLSNPSPTA